MTKRKRNYRSCKNKCTIGLGDFVRAYQEVFLEEMSRNPKLQEKYGGQLGVAFMQKGDKNGNI